VDTGIEVNRASQSRSSYAGRFLCRVCCHSGRWSFHCRVVGRQRGGLIYKKKYPMRNTKPCVAACARSDANSPLMAEEKRRPGRI
jgi:hypothetical protein